MILPEFQISVSFLKVEAQQSHPPLLRKTLGKSQRRAKAVAKAIKVGRMTGPRSSGVHL